MNSPSFVKSKLAIVTHTDGSRPNSLALAKVSVAADLPPDGVHYIVPTRGYAYYAHQRQEALKLGEFVAFVDDDDVVVGNGISRCYAAIQEANYGVAFTDEAMVDEEGNVQFTRQGLRTYENIGKYATWIHHLAMIRSSAVQEDLSQLYGRIQGVDWWILRAAIKTAGAIHCPGVGYNWVQTKNSLKNTMVNIQLPELKYTQTGELPVYKD